MMAKGQDRHNRPVIARLEDHPSSYMSTSQLARYWNVPEKEIYKYLRSGRLRAIRLGPRLLRIAKGDALAFAEHAGKFEQEIGQPREREVRTSADETAKKNQP